jgi:hypothetical protein
MGGNGRMGEVGEDDQRGRKAKGRRFPSNNKSFYCDGCSLQLAKHGREMRGDDREESLGCVYG